MREFDRKEELQHQRSSARFHTIAGWFVLLLAVVNLAIAQTHEHWQQLFEYPFWAIIGLCSFVSFSLASKASSKAKELEAADRDFR